MNKEEWLRDFDKTLNKRQWRTSFHELVMLHPLGDDVGPEWADAVAGIVNNVSGARQALLRISNQEVRDHERVRARGVNPLDAEAYASAIRDVRRGAGVACAEESHARDLRTWLKEIG